MLHRAKLIIFLKAPRKGFVKTRLAAAIGESEALKAYKLMVEHLLGNLQGLCNVELRFTPDDAEGELKRWLGNVDYRMAKQGSGDLGNRLQNAFQESFGEGFRQIAVIGSDCPYVTCNDVLVAWNYLQSCDVVLGPALDGGYWLIGLSKLEPGLFRNIPWGTGKVLGTTVSRIQEAKLSLRQLHPLQDIDVVEDWVKYLNLVRYHAL